MTTNGVPPKMCPANSPGTKPTSAGGQILVMFVVALFAIIAMIALVIEASNLFAQQRVAQNGSDSAANAGTIIVAEHLSGKARTDQQVFNAVAQAARLATASNSAGSLIAEHPSSKDRSARGPTLHSDHRPAR